MQRSDLQIDETFDRAYECTPLATIRAAGSTLYCYPGGVVGGWVEGPILEIVPHADNGDAWIGSFACGDLSPNALTGVYTLPSPHKVLVIARGEAYIVNIENPLEYEHLNILPVMGAIPITDAGLIVLHDFTRCDGYDSTGRRWGTPSISWDGLRDVLYDGKLIVGEAWDSPNDAWIAFSVDPSDGSFTGGASPSSTVTAGSRFFRLFLD
jgi:hypothetical protein